jgi:hypothetical protein
MDIYVMVNAIELRRSNATVHTTEDGCDDKGVWFGNWVYLICYLDWGTGKHNK